MGRRGCPSEDRGTRVRSSRVSNELGDARRPRKVTFSSDETIAYSSRLRAGARAIDEMAARGQEEGAPSRSPSRGYIAARGGARSCDAPDGREELRAQRPEAVAPRWSSRGHGPTELPLHPGLAGRGELSVAARKVCSREYERARRSRHVVGARSGRAERGSLRRLPRGEEELAREGRRRGSREARGARAKSARERAARSKRGSPGFRKGEEGPARKVEEELDRDSRDASRGGETSAAQIVTRAKGDGRGPCRRGAGEPPRASADFRGDPRQVRARRSKAGRSTKGRRLGKSPASGGGCRGGRERWAAPPTLSRAAGRGR